MDEATKIHVILEEYNSLRREILQHQSLLMQVYAGAGAAFVAIIGFVVVQGALIAGLLMMCVLILLVVLMRLKHDHDVRWLAAGIRRIEQNINARGQEPLLTWESKNGLLAVGYRERWKRIVGDVRTAFHGDKPRG